MSDARRDETSPPPPGLTGWNLITPHTHATRSVFSAWSWYDVARHTAASLAGALAGIVVALWSGPTLVGVPEGGTRLARAALLFALWGPALVAGLCLAAGHPARARSLWLRRLGVTVASAVPLAALAGVLAALVPPAWLAGGHHLLFSPLPGLAALGMAVGASRHIGFRQEGSLAQALCFGGIGGLAAGGALLAAAPALGLVWGIWARAAAQAAGLLPLGLALGLAHGLGRELLKRQWVLVLYGDHPGRHYPLHRLPLTIGTAPDNALVLDAAGQVQPYHAVIRPGPCGATVEALTPGALILLHDRRVTVSDLYDGDELQIGETMLRYGIVA